MVTDWQLIFGTPDAYTCRAWAPATSPNFSRMHKVILRATSPSPRGRRFSQSPRPRQEPISQGMLEAPSPFDRKFRLGVFSRFPRLRSSAGSALHDVMVFFGVSSDGPRGFFLFLSFGPCDGVPSLPSFRRWSRHRHKRIRGIGSQAASRRGAKSRRIAFAFKAHSVSILARVSRWTNVLTPPLRLFPNSQAEIRVMASHWSNSHRRISSVSGSEGGLVGCFFSFSSFFSFSFCLLSLPRGRFFGRCAKPGLAPPLFCHFPVSQRSFWWHRCSTRGSGFSTALYRTCGFGLFLAWRLCPSVCDSQCARGTFLDSAGAINEVQVTLWPSPHAISLFKSFERMVAAPLFQLVLLGALCLSCALGLWRCK